MSNILVTGADGQLGSEIRNLTHGYESSNFIFANSAQLNITNHKKVKEFVKKNNINVIINCAAYTAVDKAETEISIANEINNLAIENLAEIAKGYNAKLVHISTDYVFDGKASQPYSENDFTNPQSIYGKTKLAGEKAMQKINPEKSIIIRTSWVYSSFGNNFVKTMLRLCREHDNIGVIDDQIGTPTYAGDLASTILEILPNIKNKNVEIYHYTNEGVCSWYDFAKAIFELENNNVKVRPIKTVQYPTPAKRPYYSVMNKEKIKETFQIDIPYWKNSLKVCLEKIGTQTIHKY